MCSGPSSGQAAWMACISCVRMEMREELGRGGDPNYSDSMGYTCLMNAAEYGHVAVVKELLRHPRIQVNDTDSDNETALHLACYHGVVQLLVSYPGVNLSFRNDGCATPLEDAEREDHGDCAHILREAGNRGSQVTSHTAVHCTVRQKGPNVVVSKNVTFCCFWIF